MRKKLVFLIAIVAFVTISLIAQEPQLTKESQKIEYLTKNAVQQPTTIEQSLTDFRPSIHGWPFVNFGSFGNCGGMCWSALDCYYLKQNIDRSMTEPSRRLRDTISRRQQDTMNDWLWAKVVDWTRRPDVGHAGTPHSIGYLTQSEEWPKIKNLLTNGEPATLCVIREEGYAANPTKNHQVLAWGYTVPSQNHVSVKVYDPNYPNRDDMTLDIDLGQSNLNGKQLLGGRPLNVRMRGFFLVPYDKDVNVHIHNIDSDGAVGRRIDQRTWTRGWTQAKPFKVGGIPYLFLLKEGNGVVHIHRINDDGTVGQRIHDYNWTSGWTTVSFYKAGNRVYLFLLKREGVADDGNNVHIHIMNDDGTVGDQIAQYHWSEGWTQAKPFEVGGIPYLFLLKEGNGVVHIHRINDDGTVGQRIHDYNWTSGWTTVSFYKAGNRVYLFLLKREGIADDGNNVHIHIMNDDGTVGDQIAQYHWSEGWTQAIPFVVFRQELNFWDRIIRRVRIETTQYLFLLKEGNGEVHINPISDDGTVDVDESHIKRYNWTSGWTSVEFYTTRFQGKVKEHTLTQIIPDVRLFLLKDTQKSESYFDIPYF